MKQEDLDFLLKDLCARLLYGVKCSFGVNDAVYIITGINPTCCGASEIQATHVKSNVNGDFKLNSCKPYLFPLSSMTKKQKKTYTSYCFNQPFLQEETIPDLGSVPMCIDWLNANHFDYRGLIEKSLALDATGLGIYDNK